MPQSARPPLSVELILRLQTTVGNRAVQRLLDRRRAAGVPEIAPGIAVNTVEPQPRGHVHWLTVALHWLRKFFPGSRHE